ncbi:hypothetical protein AQUCO_00900140v1 [Aquilegia coerulea]|uniref:Uncharacterized protein n=1 Tax=Aquilegia coerulea TaxID=218851 RepID=A0A2G5EC97_AQUCA|nr:hypothetical protein AQUCO_00900140v1 [Aquilegia coerulea]
MLVIKIEESGSSKVKLGEFGFFFISRCMILYFKKFHTKLCEIFDVLSLSYFHFKGNILRNIDLCRYHYIRVFINLGFHCVCLSTCLRNFLNLTYVLILGDIT